MAFLPSLAKDGIMVVICRLNVYEPCNAHLGVHYTSFEGLALPFAVDSKVNHGKRVLF